MNTLWKSSLTKFEMADLLGVTLAQIEGWTRRGPLYDENRRRDNREYVYSRTDLAMGGLILQLQATLGDNSPLVMVIAKAARPKLQGLMGWETRDQQPTDLSLVVQRGQEVAVRVSLTFLDDLREKLERLQ